MKLRQLIERHHINSFPERTVFFENYTQYKQIKLRLENNMNVKILDEKVGQYIKYCYLSEVFR